MASRLIEDLLPELQSRYHFFEGKMEEAGLEYIVTCTYRSPEEQENLYAQGRTKPGKKVTWTLKSKHIERKAFDIAMMKNGKISWDAKDYDEPGKIGESVGLVWGGRWKSPDRPHFQIS